MTRFHPDKSVTRETDVRHQGDPIVVALYPTYLELRLKRSHYHWKITWKELLEHVAGLAEQQEKQMARREMIREASIRKPAKGADYA